MDQLDTKMAVQFLQLFHPYGPWVIQTVGDGPPQKAVFRPGQEAELAERVRAWNATRNVYFMINVPTQEWLDDPDRVKAKAVDIAEVRYLHVDLDPAPVDGTPEEKQAAHEQQRERLRARLMDESDPTCVVDSGGGYWGFWRLQKPVELDGSQAQADEAKRYNQRLKERFDADGVANVDRLARLPGTINWAGAKRERKGQVDRLATLEKFDGSHHRIGQFKKASGPKPAKAVAVSIDTTGLTQFVSVDDITELHDSSDSRNAKCRVCIAQGHDPDDPPQSRSEPLLFVCCQMLRCGCSDEAIFAVITDPRFGISASVLDKGSGAERYAMRQIEQAHLKVDAEAHDFDKDDNKKILGTLKNARLAIARLGVRLEFDEFADRALVSGLPGFGPYLDDAAVNRLWLAVEEQFQLKFGKDKFVTIVSDAARQNRRHPVREFLDGLTWDGTPRLDGWLPRYLGVEESEYARAVGTLVLVAAVRRVRKPGCKFDEMMVLEGPQGGMKSTALAALAMRPDWFSDDLPLNVKTQQFIEQTVGKWIVEAGELEGLRKGDVEKLKGCLSRQRDRSRMAYGRLPVERERQFVIIGTTNKQRYLKDSTGGRRFWPVRVGAVDLAGLKQDVVQLWAEAAAREAEGASIRLDPSLYGAAADQQEARRIDDPWLEVVAGALGGLEGKLRAADAWTIVAVPVERRTQHDNERLGEVMRELGWDRKKLRFGGAPEWCYVKGDGTQRLAVNEAGTEVCPEDEIREIF